MLGSQQLKFPGCPLNTREEGGEGAASVFGLDDISFVVPTENKSIKASLVLNRCYLLSVICTSGPFWGGNLLPEVRLSSIRRPPRLVENQHQFAKAGNQCDRCET